MLDHEWVRKLTDRCGSRFGASRSAMRSTPPRLGVWARASVVDRVGSTAASSIVAYTARGRRPIASSPSDHVDDPDPIAKARQEPPKMWGSLCAPDVPCQFAPLANSRGAVT